MPEKKQNSFKLRDFMGVNPKQITKLAAIGVKTTGQMLSAGQTAESRVNLAGKAGIPVEVVVELVKLSSLARLPGVKGIRARLYYDAGVDTVEKLAEYEPDTLLRITAEFVRATAFPGIAPLPKEVSSTIATARKLPKLVEW
jgi:predicted RecB family nuclease